MLFRIIIELDSAKTLGDRLIYYNCTIEIMIATIKIDD
jgi:hypothetical protein